VAAIAAALLSAALLLAGCTGGSEGKAAEEQLPKKNGVEPQQGSAVDVQKAIGSINRAIPIYAGAMYRDDLTRRDAAMIQNQYGADAKVYTLATDDSYPQVFHYYTTFLAQYRGFPSQDTYPSKRQNWRSLEVQLNAAMQDPFIPGESMPANGKQVLLQIAETEAEPKTVIRYIVTSAPATPAVPTSTTGGTTPAAAALPAGAPASPAGTPAR
jgi:hypothetical protein